MSDFRYPYVIGWTGEAVAHRLVWRRGAQGEKLAYADSRPGDYAQGVLRLRQRGTRAGRPDFKTVNTRRQWRCMERALCQVCGRSAVDQESGRVWWLLSGSEGPGEGYTNAPPTCPACIPEAIAGCPHLRRHAAVCTVGAWLPFAVRADVFVPYVPPVRPVAINALVPFSDERSRLCVARELVVRLIDVQPASLKKPWCAGSR
ncbi:hypothetical protein GCM10010149_06730 [Nonomuraea roseoviolacea subsp. roseoviolacea]|uniref:hypothetical protein n=1 Tax=Nonomuraea roseoviolacea TaxID=103837 RepID=UPI0031DD11E6